jgi:DNA-binding NarL/FixJ family response regulator
LTPALHGHSLIVYLGVSLAAVLHSHPPSEIASHELSSSLLQKRRNSSRCKQSQGVVGWRLVLDQSMKSGGTVNGRKGLATIRTSTQGFTIHPKSFVFFDKKTGSLRFEVKANGDGTLPIDHAASLLAVHSVMRGQRPQDFGVAVAACEDILGGSEALAEKLIKDCQVFQSPFRLTRRQAEVLQMVHQNLTNKEIAGKVNISARTVKFHISALLGIFQVADRMELTRKSANMFSQEMIAIEPADPLMMAGPKQGDRRRGGERHDEQAPISVVKSRSSR